MNLREQILVELSLASKDKPFKRYRFANENYISERLVRQNITALRKQGFRIVSSSDGGGYWIASSDKEYGRFRAEYLSRAIKIMDTVKAMDGMVEGQIGGLAE